MQQWQYIGGGGGEVQLSGTRPWKFLSQLQSQCHNLYTPKSKVTEYYVAFVPLNLTRLQDVQVSI